MRQTHLFAICVAIFLAGCAKHLTSEEKAQLQALRTDLDTTKKDVAATEVDTAKYGGGLIKAMGTVRLEVLKTNQALLEQRINALESGAKITLVALGTKADPERAQQLQSELVKQEMKATEAEAKASVQGGLIGAMAAVSATTERNSLAMLRQQFLIAKYGLAMPAMPATVAPANSGATRDTSAATTVAAPNNSDKDLAEQVLTATLLRKQFSHQEYQDYIFFDILFSAKGLDKPVRAIKGLLQLTDLFGDPQFSLRWTIDEPIRPGETYTEKGSGFKFNQFLDKHQWVRNTALENMKAKFRVEEILYQDGTTRKFND